MVLMIIESHSLLKNCKFIDFSRTGKDFTCITILEKDKTNESFFDNFFMVAHEGISVCSGVTLLFEHSPSWESKIEHSEIFSCLLEN